MKTPIHDFVKRYAESDTVRMHMPGHKGAPTLGVESLDITEIEGADRLYSADGIIAESQANASCLFGSAKTLYSTEGSSLSIRAMLLLAYLWGRSEGRDSTVIAGRNAHRVFHSAAALLDLNVEWLTGRGQSVMECPVTPAELDEALSASRSKPFAVYLTSPDYLGNMLDIKGLSQVARRHGALCLVDNAHGAYLRFLPTSRHPLELGADMCADSAHKTLPALTGAAYLHISKNAPALLSREAESAASLFASTSPSYLILQSLDRLNVTLSEGYRERLSDLLDELERLRRSLEAKGYRLIGDEPLKLTVDAKAYGYYGDEIADMLRDMGIECEHSDKDVTVLMLTPEITAPQLCRLEEAFACIQKRERKNESAPVITNKKRILSIREATLSEKERIPTHLSLGRTVADSAISCPPAIPVAVCGEQIDENALELFSYYGITEIAVVKQNAETRRDKIR